MAVWKRCLRLFKPDVHADVDDELRFHLEARITEYEARGHSHEEAVQLARDRFGDPEHVRRTLETHDLARQRSANRREYMGQLLYDVRIAIRSLRRTPAFTLTVLATLAIGIGANTSVFSVVSRELLEPLPYHDPDRLLLLYSKTSRHAEPFVSPREIDEVQHSSRSLTSVAAFGWYSGFTYVGERETLWWRGATVGPHFFETLGVQPELGRLVDSRDVQGGPAHVVVLSHAAWIQAFAGDPSIVGRTIRLSDLNWTVIGVTPADFPPPYRAPQVWTPLDLHQWIASPQRVDASMLQAIGRMADTSARPDVQAELGEAQSQFFIDWLSRIRSLPGVQAAGMVDISPWNGWNHAAFDVEHGPDGSATVLTATLGGVSDGYFAAVETGIPSGRAFLASDRVGSQRVAIVGEKFARAAWPGQSALGERIRVSGAGSRWLTVVGVADDVREDATSDADTSVYVPAWQWPQGSYETVIRTSDDADVLTGSVRDVVRAMDPAIPLLVPRPLNEIMSERLTGTRLPAILTGAFAILALVLAVLGIYGIVARTLSVSCFATASRPLFWGTAIGVVLALVGARVLAALLHGVSAHDPFRRQSSGSVSPRLDPRADSRGAIRRLPPAVRSIRDQLLAQSAELAGRGPLATGQMARARRFRRLESL